MNTHAPTLAGAGPQDAAFKQLIQHSQGPCISIYVPIEREPDQADKHMIQFKTLVSEAETTLSKKLSGEDDKDQLLRPLREKVDDKEFWATKADGVAFFVAPGFSEHYWLSAPPPSRAVVADNFHLKPLIRAVQQGRPFQVLAIGLHNVALYEAGERGMKTIELHSDVPTNIGDAIGGPNQIAKTKKDQATPEDADQWDSQVRRYFNRIDDAICRHHARPGDPPVILAALPEYQGIYKDVSDHPRLLEQGIEHDPFDQNLKAERLHELANEVLKPAQQETINELHEQFGSAKSHNQGSDNLDQIGKSACAGRVELLMLQKDYTVGGTLDHESGKVQRKTMEDPTVDDVLDDIAEHVLLNQGRVVLLDQDQMPTDTGVAALMRYPLQ